MFTQTYHTDGIVPTSPSRGGVGGGKKRVGGGKKKKGGGQKGKRERERQGREE